MRNGTAPRRLLLIEDNPTDAFLLKRALKEHGVEHELVVMRDGGQAIEYLAHCQDDAKPELIILDLNLPKEDGIEVLEKYRSSAELVHSQIMILTSSDSPKERRRAELLGVSAYLRKPFELDAFIAIGGVIRKLLESASAASPNS